MPGRRTRPAGEATQRDGVVVALLGADAAATTTLARSLAHELAALTGLSTTCVGSRVDDATHERGTLASSATGCATASRLRRRIAAAAATHAVVVAATTPLAVALACRPRQGPSGDDGSLLAAALEAQRGYAATLLVVCEAAPPHGAAHPSRDAFDHRLRTTLVEQRLSWSVIGGDAEARLAQALDALAPLLRVLAPPASGLFTRLALREAGQASWRWTCSDCDVPDCEHRLRRLQAR